MSGLFRGVLNRSTPPRAFVTELVNLLRAAPEELFAPNQNFDIYNKVRPEIGPPDGEAWEMIDRRAAMLLVLVRLAQFESECDWNEGIDTSRLGDTTPENAEAGAWQVSYGSRGLDPSLRQFLVTKGILNGIAFQRAVKKEHEVAVHYEVLLLRIDVKNFHRLENGPLYKGEERNAIRKSLRGEEQSIYPYLTREALSECKLLLA